MEMKSLCQNDDCNNIAKYALFKTYPDGSKKWIQVCDSCEQIIGMENLKRAGGRLSKK